MPNPRFFTGYDAQKLAAAALGLGQDILAINVFEVVVPHGLIEPTDTWSLYFLRQRHSYSEIAARAGQDLTDIEAAAWIRQRVSQALLGHNVKYIGDTRSDAKERPLGQYRWLADPRNVAQLEKDNREKKRRT